VGFKNHNFELFDWQYFKYCVVSIVKNHSDKLTWRMITVYVSPYDESKMEFISELHTIMGAWEGLTLLGGDFNLVRTQKEKSNGMINFTHAMTFNEWINKWGLIDIRDPSRSYSWSNNQECPIMAALDKILVLVEWVAKYLLAKITMLAKCVSNHNPLRVTFEDKVQIKNPLFRFKKWWLEMGDFADLLKRTWDIECPSSDPMEIWQFKIRLLRKRSRGGALILRQR
jgi:hypothetical protein